MEEKFTLSLNDQAKESLVPLEQLSIEIWTLSRALAQNIYDVGRRLILAKKQLPHGQFTDWLAANTPYSHATANNFMRAAQAVDENPALSAFPHTKVLALLDVPAEEREQFIADNDVASLPTRELKKAIREMEEAKAEAERQRLAAERSAGFADQYMEKYYDVQEKLNVARAQLDSLPPPETVEVPVEVTPPDYEDIKAALEAEKRRADAAESYAAQVDAAYNQERQKAQRAHIQQIDESGALADPYSPKELHKAIQEFMGCMGVLPNMDAYFATMPPERLHEYVPLLDTLEAWVKGARAATAHDGLRIVEAHMVVE